VRIKKRGRRAATGEGGEGRGTRKRREREKEEGGGRGGRGRRKREEEEGAGRNGFSPGHSGGRHDGNGNAMDNGR